MDCNKTAQCKNLHVITERLIFPKLLKIVLLMMFHKGHTNSFIILGVKAPSYLRTPRFSTLETAGSCHISFGPYIRAKCHLKSPCHTSEDLWKSRTHLFRRSLKAGYSKCGGQVLKWRKSSLFNWAPNPQDTMFITHCLIQTWRRPKKPRLLLYISTWIVISLMFKMFWQQLPWQIWQTGITCILP